MHCWIAAPNVATIIEKVNCDIQTVSLVFLRCKGEKICHFLFSIVQLSMDLYEGFLINQIVPNSSKEMSIDIIIKQQNQFACEAYEISCVTLKIMSLVLLE